MSAAAYDRERVELTRCLDEVIALDRVDQDACARLQNKLAEETFNLVAAGEFKRGKSSVINALLGQALLPVGVIPLTSVVTVVRYGATPACTIVFEAGERQDVGLEMLADYVTENANPKNIKHVREVLISYPSAWLESGVRLIDTPGIGSVYEHNSDVTRRYLPQADAVLFVASVDQPMSRGELDFLASIRPYADKIFCLLNKTDYLSPDELRESLQFSTQVIHEALGGSVPIYPVSARVALEEKRGTRIRQLSGGFREFEEALRRFIAEEKTTLWLQSVARSLLRILSQVRLGVDLEMAALAAPLEQIKDNLEAFEIKKQQTLRAKADYEVLLEADLKTLLKSEIEPRLTRFKQSEQGRMPGLVTAWLPDLRSLSSAKLQAALEQRSFAEIRSAYDGWLASEEPAIARAVDALCERFWSGIQGTIDDLHRYSATLFSVQFTPIEGTSVWKSESGFHYKFWYEPVGLQTLSFALVCALPAFIGHPLIVRRMQRVALDSIETQAGRIRHDFEERLKKSRQDFGRQLLGRIDATITGIQVAIENGLAMRRRGDVEAGRRRIELRRTMEQVTCLEGRIKATVAG